MVDVYQYLILTTVVALGVMLAVWLSNASFFFFRANDLQKLNGDIPLVRIATMINTTALLFLLFFVLTALMMYALQVTIAIPAAISLALIGKWRHNAYILKLYNLKFTTSSFLAFVVIDILFFAAMVATLPYDLI